MTYPLVKLCTEVDVLGFCFSNKFEKYVTDELNKSANTYFLEVIDRHKYALILIRLLLLST